MTDWNKLKVTGLKEELKKRGLAQSGLKAALVARLIEAEAGDGSESEATVQGEPVNASRSRATSPDTISPVQPSDGGPDIVQTTYELQPEPTSQLQLPDTTSHHTSDDKPFPTQSSSAIDFSQSAEANDSHQSALPSAELQEAIEDRQKRKRRSQSPLPSATDIHKRLKEDVEDQVVTSKEDANWVEKHNAVDPAEVNAAAKEVAAPGMGVEPGPTIVDVARDEVVIEEMPQTEKRTSATEAMDIDDQDVQREGVSEPPEQPRDTRFTGLSANLQGQKPALEGFGPTEIEQERTISPAIHPATSALYIKDFMRPLNPSQLKSYLATLAAPPGQSPDEADIADYWLDPIRTHAFISFTNVSAASRVRSAIHDRIWPDERNRKPLWADFVPAEKIGDWIAEEEFIDAGRRPTARKWEIQYDIDEDRHVTAILREGTNVPRAQDRKPYTAAALQAPPQALPSREPDRNSSGSFSAPSGPRAMQARGQAANAGQRLDQLFKSTIAKPVLYWQPVSKSLANNRVGRVTDATAKGYDRRAVSSEINRYTFEDGDVLVDRGPEIFSGIRPPRRDPDRGPPIRRGGRGGGGGYRGGSYGYRDERPYDSYRSDRGYDRGYDGGYDRDRRY